MNRFVALHAYEWNGEEEAEEEERKELLFNAPRKYV